MEPGDNKRKDLLVTMPQCPVCGSTSIRHSFRIHTYECQDCGYAVEEEPLQDPNKIVKSLWN